MNDTAKRIASEIAATLSKLDISVSNVLIGRFGITMDAASQKDAGRAADMLRAQGCTNIRTGVLDGEWTLVGDLS